MLACPFSVTERGRDKRASAPGRAGREREQTVQGQPAIMECMAIVALDAPGLGAIRYRAELEEVAQHMDCQERGQQRFLDDGQFLAQEQPVEARLLAHLAQHSLDGRFTDLNGAGGNLEAGATTTRLKQPTLLNLLASPPSPGCPE